MADPRLVAPRAPRKRPKWKLAGRNLTPAEERSVMVRRMRELGFDPRPRGLARTGRTLRMTGLAWRYRQPRPDHRRKPRTTIRRRTARRASSASRDGPSGDSDPDLAPR